MELIKLPCIAQEKLALVRHELQEIVVLFFKTHNTGRDNFNKQDGSLF